MLTLMQNLESHSSIRLDRVDQDLLDFNYINLELKVNSMLRLK